MIFSSSLINVVEVQVRRDLHLGRAVEKISWSSPNVGEGGHRNTRPRQMRRTGPLTSSASGAASVATCLEFET